MSLCRRGLIVAAFGVWFITVWLYIDKPWFLTVRSFPFLRLSSNVPLWCSAVIPLRLMFNFLPDLSINLSRLAPYSMLTPSLNSCKAATAFTGFFIGSWGPSFPAPMLLVLPNDWSNYICLSFSLTVVLEPLAPFGLNVNVDIFNI